MDPRAREAFEKFLLDEYEHVANAHFNALATISQFFKHYVTMIGLPLAAIPIVIKIFPAPAKAIARLKGYEAVVMIASIIVAAIGFCMILYIASLQNLSLVYARTVNGIRDYFYRIAALEPKAEDALRVLPRTVEKPRYFRKSFLPAIVAFALLDGTYPALGLFLLSLIRESGLSACTIMVIIGTLGASVIVQVFAYWLYAHFKWT